MKSTDFWVVFDTNIGETQGFFETVPISAFVYCGIYFIISTVLFVMVLHSKETCKHCRWYFGVCAIVVWLIVSLCLPFRIHVSMIDFYKSYHKFKHEQRLTELFFQSRLGFKVESRCYFPSDISKNLVVVIGESATRMHYSLYGYGRETNPLLSSISNELAVYTDVVSPAIQTLTCMNRLLTFCDYSHPNMHREEASIVEIARDAGYKTYWIDNQGGKGSIDALSSTTYRCMAKMCDYFYVNSSYIQDDSLLFKVDSCLHDTSDNKLIFVHLNGSHFPYKIRYPETFSYFKGNSYISAYSDELTPDEIETLNAYDNSILYNDYVLYQLISLLKNYSGMSAMIYCSDHGEEVYDYQHYAGRSFDKLSPAMFEIPFIFWQNQQYLDITQFEIQPNRVYSTDQMIHTYMDMIGVSYPLKDTTKSIFSQQFRPIERMVNDKNVETFY